MNITQSNGFQTLVKTDVMPITMKGIKSIAETPYGVAGNALSELIDNSWEKGYGTTFTNIVSTFEKGPHGKLKLVKVIDDGPGMNRETLEQCFKIGSETEKDSSTLGLYGIGQKSACLWMADSYELLTKQEDGELLSATFSYEDGLQMGVVTDEKLLKIFKSHVNGNHGTIIFLRKIRTDRFPTKKSFTAVIKRNHGLTYSQGLKNGTYNMFVNGEKVTPIEFVDYENSTLLSEPNAVFTFTDNEGNTHQIPYEAWFTPSSGNGKDEVISPNILSRTADNQGFICLRNERMVGRGQLLGVIKTRNPIMNGLKIILHIDGSLDSYFGVSFGKTQKGQIANDVIREQFVKEFKHYFVEARRMQQSATAKGETTKEFKKAVEDIQKEIMHQKAFQDIIDEYRCSAAREGEGDCDNPDGKTDQSGTEKKPKDNTEDKKNKNEKKHRKPRVVGRKKWGGNTIQFTVEERGIDSPYFIPEVDEDGTCKCVTNSSHNYYLNHLHSFSRASWNNHLKLIFAEWVALFGKGMEPDEDTLTEYMRNLQDKSDVLQKLYKDNMEAEEEIFDEVDDVD